MLKIALTGLLNIDNLTLAYTAKFILNHTCITPQIVASLSLFSSDMPTKSDKKSEKAIHGEFLWWDACRQIRIKDFLPT